jgi:hypothetical protein
VLNSLGRSTTESGRPRRAPSVVGWSQRERAARPRRRPFQPVGRDLRPPLSVRWPGRRRTRCTSIRSMRASNMPVRRCSRLIDWSLTASHCMRLPARNTIRSTIDPC